MNINVVELNAKLGECLQYVAVQPVVVEQNSCPLAVIMSYDLYEKLLTLEDAYWGQRAMEAAKGGFLGEEETLRELANIAAEKGISLQ
ncbi:MAG: hypothetical protein BWK78_04420 [Thiotrichaceae bacterium IS1]|nr:MAG: hypothetical protein BWK78_04420 [Thiotrichaceae bacterium IS1]